MPNIPINADMLEIAFRVGKLSLMSSLAARINQWVATGSLALLVSARNTIDISHVRLDVLLFVSHSPEQFGGEIVVNSARKLD